MMITSKDKIGYILRRTTVDGKEHFNFIESKIKSVRIGKTKTSVYSDKFYTLDAEDIEFNTEIMSNGNGLIIVNEPFITNDELSEHCRQVVEHWNKYGAKSFLSDDEVEED